MAQKFLTNIEVLGKAIIDGSNFTSGSTVLDVQGTQGQLFSVTNSLTGDLFAVSDISGIPILNVNSSGSVNVDGSFTVGGNITTVGGNIIAGGAIYPTSNASASLGLSTKQWAGLDLSSSSAITWGNGDAEIVEGETNNYSLTFKTYDGTNNSAALRLDGDNTATFTGNISATNFSGSSSGTNTGDQDLSGYLTSSSTQSKYIRSDEDDNFTGQLVNNSRNETPAYNKGAINLQPSTSGGSTGITFRSKVNSTSDAGYIWWYDNNDHYNELDSTENGVLLIAAQNDGGATSEDAIAIESSGDIYLNPGVASGAIGSGTFNSARGNIFLGNASSRVRILTTTDGDTYSTATGVADDAEANVQADWNETTNTDDAYIKNKPTVVEPGRLYRQTGANDSASIGPGWISVARNTSSRRHGEVIVSDSESGDHAFIRIDWMRSYADSNFTVLNVGGHANRITGVRVLSQDSDDTYGEKILQVYVTVASVYGVRVHNLGTPKGYTNHTSMTPILEDTKTGYSVHGNTLENLNNSSLAAEEGLTVGGNIAVGGTVDGVDISALPTSFLAIGTTSTTAMAGDTTIPAAVTDYVSAANGGTFSGNVNVITNAGTGTFRVGRYSGQEFKLHSTDLTNTITSIQDADENQAHDFILNREHAGSGADNFIIQKDGSNQLTIDKDGLVTIAGNLTVGGTTTTLNTQTVEVEDNILQLNTTQGTPDTATATTSGISIYRGVDANDDAITQASLIFDDGDDTWDLTNDLTVAGDVIGASFAVPSGASTGFLKADGSVDSTTYSGYNFAASDLTFQGTDPGDIVWKAADGTEVHRIWSGSADYLTYRNDAGTTYGIIHEGFSGYNNGDWDNAFTHAESAHAPTDAEKNVQADWTETTTTSDAFILNKPTTFAPSAHNHSASEITSGTFSTDRIPEFVPKYTYQTGSSGIFMPMVKGGISTGNAGTTTGRLRIRLPHYKEAVMQSFIVDVYEYNSNRFQSYKVSGYSYNDAGATWYNTSVISIMDSDNRDLTVRFGSYETAEFQCVSIGETDSVWTYPQVVVRDYLGGHSAALADFSESFVVEFVTTDLATYDQTHNNNQPYADWNRIDNKPSTFSPSSHNHDDRYYTETEIDAQNVTLNETLAALRGWVPGFSNSDDSSLTWDRTEDALKIKSETDNSIGAVYKAMRVKAGMTIRVTVTVKGNVAGTDGLYLRLQKHDGDLPDGKTHVSHDASNSSEFVQEDDSEITSWYENGAISTDWVTHEKDVTITSDGYISFLVLNWTGNSTDSIWVKNPDIQIITAGDSDKLDGQQGTYYLDYNNFSNTPTIPTDHGDHDGLYLPIGGGTVTGDLKLNTELKFQRSGANYSNYIRSQQYVSEGYDNSGTPPNDRYWLEYGAKGGHHFVVNTDGGAGSAENPYDDFTIWQGDVDGDRLFEVTNAGNVTTAGNVKVKDALIDNASTTSATTTTTVASISGTNYAAVFFDYVIYKSSNIRAGTVVACSDGTSVSFTETSTTDLGDTSDVTLAVDYSSANMRLRATTTSSTWTIKSLIRAI